MSVSDPAPLPRLGEVFFDVRGNSRSMRLSWYADTGVAVFSIWQAGMCTGTFRLPMADLSRMIEILERGPAPQARGQAPVGGSRPEESGRSDSDWYYAPDEEELGAPPGAVGGRDGRGAEYPAEYGRSDDYGRSEYPASHGRGESGATGYDPADYGRGETGPASYEPAGYEPAGYDAAGYDPADYGRSETGPAERGRASHGRTEPGAGDYGQAGYGPPVPAERRDEDLGADRYGNTTGYGQVGHDGQDRADAAYSPSPNSYGSAGSSLGGADGYRTQGYSAGYGRGESADDGGYGRGYEPDGYSQSGHGAAEADYLTGEYPSHQSDRRASSDRGYPASDYDDRQDFRTGGHRRDDGGLPRGVGGQPGAEPDASAYAAERFAAPYEADSAGSYRNDNRGPRDGYQPDFGDAGYPADRRRVSAAERYQDSPAPEEAYSYGAEYRYR